MPTAQLHPAVEAYLADLEIELKKVPGIVPEDALADAREHLQSEAGRSLLPDKRLLAHFHASYGTPADVAQAYNPGLGLEKKRGYAPGWRISCAKCGRSAPLDRLPVIRAGARSRGKFILGFCRGCGWLRWLRVEQDLDKATLTEGLGADKTPEELRASLPNPWRVIATIIGLTLGLVFAINAVVWGILWLVKR